jgi:hypothetical protein
MTNQSDETEQEIARVVIAECVARLHHEARLEMENPIVNDRRIAGIQLALTQLREERKAIIGGDDSAIDRALYMYAVLLKQVHHPRMSREVGR